MSLELLVRPFQSPNVAPGQMVPSVSRIAAPVMVRIDGTGGAAIWEWSESASSQTTIFGNKHTETDRKSETVRVTNPQDDQQWVEIQRAKSITFADDNNPKQKNTYNFKYLQQSNA